MQKKQLDLSKYNRKIESLGTLLCDRLAQMATQLCELLALQVKLLHWL